MNLKTLSPSLVLLGSVSLALAQSTSAPEGWTVSQNGANLVYAPTQVPAGGTFTLTIEPPAALGGQDLNAWMTPRIQTDMSRRGAPAKAVTPQQVQGGALTAIQSYRDGSGKNWTMVYFAAPLSGGQAQFGYMQSNLPVSSAVAYFRTAGTIFGKSVAAERTSPTPSTQTPSSAPSNARVATGDGHGLPATASKSSLTGLYFRSQFQVMIGMGSRYDWYFYLFSPEGRVYNGFPAAGTLDHFDFAAAAVRDPKNTGTYHISGNRIDFSWGGGRKPESSPYVINPEEVEFLGEHWRPADTDPRKQAPNWLRGTFRYQMGASVGGSSGMSQVWYTFQPDGTFQGSTSAAVLAGAPVPQANRSRNTQGSGTFQLSGTTLSLQYTDGRTVQHTVFPYGKAIFLDGTTLIHP
jgi:hypothetical protein